LPDRSLGVEAARVAVRILRGEVPSSIQTKAFEASTPVYDWRELRRWGIDEHRLPPGSIVQFREPTFWERYKREIILVLALCILEAVLIVLMLWERGRRRQSEQNFRRLVETTAAIPWRADVETWAFTYVGPQAVKLLGYPLEQWYEKDFWVSHFHPTTRVCGQHVLTLSNSAEASNSISHGCFVGENVWLHDISNRASAWKASGAARFMFDISERNRLRRWATKAKNIVWPQHASDSACGGT
jgi:PAS domain-containing protein